jgi:ABC-type multidrug transport system ATPase subunit
MIKLLGNPALLVLDEPTSGLDSNKALKVVKTLKKLALEQKKTVIFTLHQPSFLIYQELDRLILLNKGNTVYQGKSNQIYNYLTENLKLSVPLDLTISDFFMM